MAADAAFMAEALALGLAYKGRTTPNPAVGAVVVSRGRVVGRGVHTACGRPHAEVIALKDAGDRGRGATLYVTLEPCVVTGRTPPCAPAIIKGGIKRVVVGTLDPNPAVAGRGVRYLRDAGITVEVGVGERKCRHLAEDFATWITAGRPWITAKYAMSLDGKIATRVGESRWITSPPALRQAHVIRRQHAAVMVGRNTALRDDPRLTVRLDGGEDRAGPVRIVVSARAEVNADGLLWRTAPHPPVWLVCTTRAPRRNALAVKRLKGEVIVCRERGGRVDVEDMLEKIAARGITSVVVEGGAALLGDFADAGFIDRVAAFVAPCLIGGAKAVPAVGGKGIERMAAARRLREVKGRRVGKDWFIEGYLTDVDALFERALGQERRG